MAVSQQQWSARACPTRRRELADAYQARADRIRAMTGPHLPDWMLADGQRSTQSDERAAWELRGIDLYWVTGEMARLAMDAALDMPEFDARQLASPHGMIFFQRPLPAIQSQPCEIYTGQRVESWQGEAQVWAVSWHPRQDRIAVTAYTRLSEIPGATVPGADLQPILFMLADREPFALGDRDLITDQGSRVDKRALGGHPSRLTNPPIWSPPLTCGPAPWWGNAKSCPHPDIPGDRPSLTPPDLE